MCAVLRPNPSRFAREETAGAGFTECTPLPRASEID